MLTLPAWARAALQEAAAHALRESDWREHGGPKVLAWTLDDFGRFLTEVYGESLDRGLCDRLGSKQLFARTAETLAEGFLDRDGLYERRPSTTKAWVAQRVADALGIRFERGVVLRISRMVATSLEAAERRRQTKNGKGRLDALMQVARDTDQLELLERLRQLYPGPPPLAQVIDAGRIPLEAVLGITWIDDEDAAQAVLEAQLRAADPVPYTPSRSFFVGDVLEHPKLGRAVVTAIEDQRIVARFVDGERKLACGRAP
jgi:hypothetical protein